MADRKKILIVGASGSIGKYVASEIAKKHNVIRASRSSGDVNVDMRDRNSIEAAFKKLQKLDAVVCTAGETFFGDFNEITEEDFYKGIRGKMMGQINLVLIGKNYINENGSFTLTTGILSERPIKGAVNSTTVNNAIHGFVLSVSRELKRGIRINAVCPSLVEASVQELGHLFAGFNVVPMNRVAMAYLASVDGTVTGQIIRVY